MKLGEMAFENLPQKLVERLMPFQKDGVKFAIRKNGRCLIADEMGLGKTLQAISVAYYYKNEWPLLIIVPSSLRYSWIEEFEKWLPDINPGDINLVQSGSDVSDIATAQVTITTFGLLSKGTSRILREALMNQRFHVVIVDESHYIRNTKTVSAKTVVPLIKNANRRILLSGTPALARPVELYPQIDAVCPDEFGTWWTYTARYCDARLEWIGKVKRRNVNGASNLEELQQRLSDKLMIRREKNQVLTQLPPKQRQRVLFELKDSDLKKEIRQTFDELRLLLKRSNQDNFEVLTGGGDSDTKDINMLSLIQRLYKLSGTAKIGPAKEYVEMLCDNQKLKFLVFAYHHDMMNGLSESLHDKKVKFIRIDGETPPSERPHLVHQFQSDPDTRVAILSILAAGVGLTFTAATVVVFAEMYWTPGTMIQCEDRAHRIGQTSCVAVHNLVAKDTMDEWVWSAVCKKTIVTSTTLTGKKRKMEALEGDRYQVDVLSNADVWVPSSNSENSNLTQYFETALDSSQKSILHFFSPSNSKKIKDLKSNSKVNTDEVIHEETTGTDTKENTSMEESSDEQDCITPPRKRIKTDSDSLFRSKDKLALTKKDIEKENAIVIDSDEDDFVEKSSSTKSNKKALSSSKKSNRGRSRKTIVSPKYSLEAVFEKVKNKEHVRESIDLRNDEKSPVDIAEDTSSVNENSMKKCTEQSKDVRMDRTEWSCSQCTYLNHIDLTYCEMCETPKKCRAVSRVPDDIHNKNSSKLGTSSKLSETKNRKILGVTEQTVTNKFNGEFKVDGGIADEKEDEEDISHFIDDTIDYDPGVDYDPAVNACCDEDDEKIEEFDELEPEDVTNGDNIDEICSPSSDKSREKNDEDDKIKEKIQMSRKQEHGKLEESGYENFSSLRSCYRLNNEKSDFTSRKQLEISESMYFNKTELCSLNTSRFKRKEVVIANNLKFKSDKGLEKKIQETERAKIRCSKEAADKLESQTGTPTSGKKYRFKSVRRNKSLGSSSIVSSPSLYLGNENFQNEDRLETENNMTESEASVGERIKGKNHEISDEELTENSKAGKHTCRKVNHIDTEKETDMESDLIATPESEQMCKDYSFSSPEFDELLVNETEDIASNVSKPVEDERRVVHLDNVPVYTMFKYQCSKYTDRIYLLTQNEDALNINFIPSDVQFGNDDGLPDVLLHPDNLRLVQRFVREWLSLTETKRRLIVKSGQPFISPLLQYEKLKSCKSFNTQRHKTKMDTSKAAHQKAKDINGSVRLVSKYSGVNDENSGEKGVAQAVTEDGTPLCLQCFQPFTNQLITKASIQDENNAWSTRFCSRKCSQEYWMVCNNDFMRDRVFEAEHGICQMCNFDAQSLFRQVRDTVDQRKRAEVISRSKFSALTVKVKEQMVRKPAAGQFWHVDHIVPVWEGGGQCDIDNLRTLCVICHQKVTARQAAKRATVRKLGTAVSSGDITAFFQRN